MSDYLYKELGDALSDLKPKESRVMKGQLGYIVKGLFRIICDDKTKFFVRLDDGSFQEASHNGKVSPKPNLPVKVQKIGENQYEIVGPDNELMPSFDGAYAGSYGVGMHSHERGSGMEFPIDPYLIGGLKARPFSGMIIEITPGYYTVGKQMYWFQGGTLDLTTLIPVTAYHHAIAIIGINHVTNQPVGIAGTSQLVSVALTGANMPTGFVASGYIPLFSIRLKNGQSSVLSTDFLDIRLSPYITGDFAAPLTVQVGASSSTDVSSIEFVGATLLEIDPGTIRITIDAPPSEFTGDAFDVPFSPTTVGDWTVTPSDVGVALDALASDVADLIVGGGVPLTVKETDSSPSVSNVSEMQFAPGLLTNLGGGVVSIARSRMDLYGEPDGSLMGLSPHYWQEFDGSSLPGDWSVTGGSFSAGPTADAGRSCADMEATGFTAIYKHMLAAGISGDFEFEAKIWGDFYSSTGTSNGIEVALIDASSALVVSNYLYNINTNYYYNSYSTITGTSYTSGLQMPLIMSRNFEFYLRFVRYSGLVTTYYSLEGKNWTFMCSKSSVTTTIGGIHFKPYRQAAGSVSSKGRIFYARINS